MALAASDEFEGYLYDKYDNRIAVRGKPNEWTDPIPWSPPWWTLLAAGAVGTAMWALFLWGLSALGLAF